MAVLDAGTTLPTISLTTTAGDLVLPDALAGSFGVVLVYRGAWCPYCNAQLASFKRATEQLEAEGIKVVALSVDDRATTQELVAKHRLPRRGSARTRKRSTTRGVPSSTPSRTTSSPPASCSPRRARC